MIRVAIVEDDPVGVDQLVAHLDRYRRENQVELTIRAFADGADIVSEYQPEWDILLLDVEMPGLDGMSAARKIREVDSEVIIVFITSSPHYAVSGYQVDALSYLLKPLNYATFAKELERSLSRIGMKERRHLLFTAIDGAKHRLDLVAVEYIESMKHQVAIHSAKGKFVVSTSMRAMEDELSSEAFFRIHSGFLVNLRHVVGVEGSDCRMRNGALVPVSRARKKEFLTALADYIGSRGVIA